MKLVIDPQHVGQCTMVIGKLEIPLTREQVVQTLYGEEYEIVRVGSSVAKKQARPRPIATESTVDAAKARRRSPALEGSIRQRIVELVREGGSLSLPQIREGLVRTPQLREEIERRPQTYLAAAIIRMTESGSLKRAGTRGTFVYSTSGARSSATPVETPPELAKGAGLSDVVQEARRKKALARFKKGLCSRCDKPHIPEKKLCRAHYRTILEAQKSAVASRNANTKKSRKGPKPKKKGGEQLLLNGATSHSSTSNAASAEAVN